MAESAAALARYAAAYPPESSSSLRYPSYATPAAVQAMSRIYAREAAMRIATEGLRWIQGSQDENVSGDLATALNMAAVYQAQRGLLADTDRVAQAIRDT
jgi:hypothetical protein